MIQVWRKTVKHNRMIASMISERNINLQMRVIKCLKANFVKNVTKQEKKEAWALELASNSTMRRSFLIMCHEHSHVPR
jgi:hypothetical protein